MAPIYDAETEFFRKSLIVRDARPVISTSAYANGDCVGGLQTISSAVNADGLAAYLHSITIVDESAQDTAFSFIFFSENPSASTFADNAAISIAAADRDKILGVVAAGSTDYFPVGSGLSVASLRGLGLSLDTGAEGNDLWVAAIANEAGTYAGTDGLIFRFGLAQG